MTTTNSSHRTFYRKRSTPPDYVIGEEILNKGYDPYVVKHYYSFLKPYLRKIIISLALMSIASGAVILGPYIVQIAIDKGMGLKDQTILLQAALAYTAAAIIQWITTYIRVHIMVRVGQGVIYDLRARLFEHLQALSLNFFSHYSVGRPSSSRSSLLSSLVDIYV